MDTGKWMIFLTPLALAVVGVVVWLMLRRTVRTRLRMVAQLARDPDMTEWLVVFNWSRKVLYLPTIIASLAAAGVMYLCERGAVGPACGFVVGGIWLGVFFVNFLVDEYEMNLKVLMIGVLAVLVFVLWLSLLGWLGPFMRLFTQLRVQISAEGYLVMAFILLLAVGVSWIKGLFYYVTITPNYINIQSGPTETGEQISREDYNTRIDTGDFLERVMGFGRIIITFSEPRRQPLTLLLGGIGSKAVKLESIRGILAIDRPQPPG